MKDSIFYSYEKVLSYGAILNIIIGERGVGKTYGSKVYVIKRFLKKHKKFVYLRRYESDLEASVGNNIEEKFFEQVHKEFPNSEFKIVKHKKVRSLIIDGQVCGYAMPLSASASLKSSTYEDVDTIIYDEFQLKNGSGQHYLRNEPEIILDMIETIGRLRKIKVFLLGNAISSTSPIMNYFNLTLPYNSDIKLFKDGLILVNYIKNEKYREVKKQTDFGKLIEGTKYGEYAIDNVMLTDSKAFIKKKSEGCHFYFTFVLNYSDYGVWINYNEESMYISKNVDPNCPMKLTINNDDHSESTLLVKARVNPYLKNVINYYRSGHLYFESQQLKNIFLTELLRFIY